jgi:hypothetical protein
MPTQKHTTAVRSQRDGLSYLWLALGIVLLPFAMPNWTIPLAARLASRRLGQSCPFARARLLRSVGRTQ